MQEVFKCSDTYSVRKIKLFIAFTLLKSQKPSGTPVQSSPLLGCRTASLNWIHLNIKF